MVGWSNSGTGRNQQKELRLGMEVPANKVTPRLLAPYDVAGRGVGRICLVVDDAKPIQKVDPALPEEAGCVRAEQGLKELGDD